VWLASLVAVRVRLARLRMRKRRWCHCLRLLRLPSSAAYFCFCSVCCSWWVQSAAKGMADARRTADKENRKRDPTKERKKGKRQQKAAAAGSSSSRERGEQQHQHKQHTKERTTAHDRRASSCRCAKLCVETIALCLCLCGCSKNDERAACAEVSERLVQLQTARKFRVDGAYIGR
jgi:hypothetical protein